MHILRVRNVCDALPKGLNFLLQEGYKETSRAGDVIVAPVPVMTVTQFPRERVLFSAARDANPFFHLAEGIWMLAGRYDAKFLDQFVSNKYSNLYAEKDGAVHDAYGFRWRHG